ncbi:MAG: hypothetical protein HMLKMBBP_03491 [Planctomycetes bacterium]|nr:hypothetical protein [Planctomycetota bacterium]
MLACPAHSRAATTIPTLGDPVNLGADDRATVNWNIHYIWSLSGGATTLTWKLQVSNDGVHWVDATSMTDSTTAATGSTPRQKIGAVNGEFLRFVVTLSHTGGDLGGACYDLHVKLDHA